MQPTTVMAGGQSCTFADPAYRDQVAAMLRRMYLAHEISPAEYEARTEDLAVIASRRTVRA